MKGGAKVPAAPQNHRHGGGVGPCTGQGRVCPVAFLSGGPGGFGVPLVTPVSKEGSVGWRSKGVLVSPLEPSCQLCGFMWLRCKHVAREL